MSYTPPAGSAVDFTWAGAAAYTPPAGNAADLGFGSTAAQATLRGVGLLGAPRITTQAPAVAQIQAMGLLGAPVLTANPRTVGWLTGPGLLGAPTLTAAGVVISRPPPRFIAAPPSNRQSPSLTVAP